MGGVGAGEQDQGTFVGEVQDPFDGRADVQELVAEPVDRPGPIGDKVVAVSHQHPQFGDQFVLAAHLPQVTAHPGLIGDDGGVACIGLALTSVTVSGAVDHVPGKVGDLLTGCEQQRHQQRHQQRGASAAHVDRPGRLIGRC